MSGSPELSHCVTALIDAPARAVFDFMADPIALGRWSLGCMSTRPADDAGVYTGFSFFDGSQAWFEIDAREDLLLIDYHIGSRERRVPRISARAIPAEVCGLVEGQCYLTLTAWRALAMDDPRWRRLCATHETEIWLIKAQIETARAAKD